MAAVIGEISRWIIPLLLLGIFAGAAIRRVNIYEAFIEGAGEGFQTAVRLIPYLLAMMVAISVFRASGAMAMLAGLLSPLTDLFHVPAEVLPLAMLRPLSGGGALGVSAELINTFGPDSYIGRLASTMQGSSDTTFFVLTLYFGSVGIRDYRSALWMGLLADALTFAASIFFVRWFFGY